MVIVTKKKGESDDKLINRFRKAVADEEVIENIRRRQRWVSKGEERKEREKAKKILIKQSERKNL